MYILIKHNHDTVNAVKISKAIKDAGSRQV